MLTKKPNMYNRLLIDPANFCLILTASIRPIVMPSVTVPNPVAREEDYLAALRYYLTEHTAFRRITFIDNSGWALNRFSDLAGQFPHARVELISLNINNFPAHLGKSYGEMQLLELGLSQSKLASESQYLAKITGRIRLTNLTKLIMSVRRHFDLMCDLSDHSIYEWLRVPIQGHKVDARFLVFRQRFFDKYLRGRLDELNEQRGEYIEDLFYHVASARPMGERIIDRLPLEPAFAGLAGHLEKDYLSGRERFKRRWRATLRAIVPWLKV